MDARRYLAWLLGTFLLVLALVASINFAVDPFGYHDRPWLAADQSALSEYANDQLFRLAQFRRRPRPIVLLGDSRTKNLEESYFDALGMPVANLATGGGTLFEAIDTFWYVDRIQRPQAVAIGLPFNLWSDANARNRVGENVAVLARASNYYLSRYVLHTSLVNVLQLWRGESNPSHAPPVSSDEFWNYQLGHGIGQFYGRWREPTVLRSRLAALARHCREHGIRLVIFNPPTHVDLQRQVAAYGLQERYDEYLRAMRQFGTFLDLDVENATTMDRRRFADPFHAHPDVMRDVAATLAQHLRAASQEGIGSP